MKINGTEYKLFPMTRGDVREIENLKGGDVADAIVRKTLQQDDIEYVPMPDYTQISKEAVKLNGLDPEEVVTSKKNSKTTRR